MPKQAPMKWPLPDVVHPPDTICFRVNVPNNRAYIGAFYGAMFLLSKPYAWGDDAAHTAIEVGKVWRDIFDGLIAGDCVDLVPTFFEELEYQMSICEQLRWQNGVLQGFCCGEWVNIAGQPPQGIGGTDQPGNGSEQPQPGGCALYHGKMGAKAVWYLPTVVSDGDTIEVSSVTGIWNDGGEVAWRDYTGDQSFGGNNVGNPVLVGTDPLPSVNHMALICLIDATYYDLSSGVLTVSGGHSNAQVTLQPNDSPIDNDNGELSFDITVCNNQAAAFTHVFNFALEDGGFAAAQNPSCSNNPLGIWTAGQGWLPYTDYCPGPNISFKDINLTRSFSARTITSVQAFFSLSLGTIQDGAQIDYFAGKLGGSTVFSYSPAIGSPPSSPWTWPGSGTLDFLQIALTCGNITGNTDPGGTLVLTKLIVVGEGTDPF